MKKLLLIAVSALSILTLAACGNNSDTSPSYESQNLPSYSSTSPEEDVQTQDLEFEMVYEPLTIGVLEDDVGPFIPDILNLADLTLIPESVHVLTPYDDPHGQWGDWDMYIWSAEVRGVANLADIFVARQGLDNNNEHRIGFDERGSDMVLSIVRLNENGDMVGMMYLVPDSIVKEHDLQ